MDEKNDAVVTEKEVFLYIRSHPGCKKMEIVEALYTNSWQVSHKLRKMIRSSVITESGTGKYRCYRVSAEFEKVEPTFKKASNRRQARYVPRHKRVIDVYKKMLTGEELDKIDAPDDVKATIRLFEKYKSRSAYQIWEITGIYTTLSAELRRLDREKLRKCSKKSFARVPSVGWTVRQIALGTPLSVIRVEVTDETLDKAIKFIKMANSGAKEFEIGKAIFIGSHQLKTTMKAFKSQYAEKLKDFEPEKYLVQPKSVKVIL
ncbi:MAG TPA: hypothetical protein VGK06_15985 [Methanosarcina sp.]|jgi:hypothetical protein